MKNIIAENGSIPAYLVVDFGDNENNDINGINDIELINPDNLSTCETFYRVSFPCGNFAVCYIVCTNEYQEALDIMMDFAEKHAKGFIFSEEELEEEMAENPEMVDYVCAGNYGNYFNDLGGPAVYKIKAKKFTFSVTYETWNEEEREAGETFRRGYKEEGEIGQFSDIIDRMNYFLITEKSGGDWLTSTGDYDYKTGDDTIYHLHIQGFGRDCDLFELLLSLV